MNQNARGHWELASPLPDCPVGSRAEKIHNSGWQFCGHYGAEGNRFNYDEDTMRRNPAIFRWVPEPEPTDNHRGCRNALAQKDEDYRTLNDESCHEIEDLHEVIEGLRGMLKMSEKDVVNFKEIVKENAEANKKLRDIIAHRQAKEGPEPERVEWPRPGLVYKEGGDTWVSCCSDEQQERTMDLFRAVLQSLREGKIICTAHEVMINRIGMKPQVTLGPPFDILIRPDGSRP